MRKDYRTVNALTLGQKKKYLLKINTKKNLQLIILDCMSDKQLNQFIHNQQINKELYVQALKSLYSSESYEDLEYHLVMMNSLFQYKSYEDIKKQLFDKLCKKAVTIHEYCVLRQLVSINNNHFSDFVSYLYNQLGVEAQECARICLLEDEHHLAYEYLKKLDNCYDEILLDLLSGYSLYEYTSLMRHYAKKKRGYILMPSH